MQYAGCLSSPLLIFVVLTKNMGRGLRLRRELSRTVRGLIKKAIFNLGEELTYIVHLTLPLYLKNHKKLLALLSGEGRAKIADCMSFNAICRTPVYHSDYVRHILILFIFMNCSG